MKNSLSAGLGFGITSGVITTLGLTVGLLAGNASRVAVISGIIIIAISDAFSDSLGMHISQESQNKSKKDIWYTSITTFFAKAVVAFTFIIPIIIFTPPISIHVEIIWGFLILSSYSYYIAKKNKTPVISVLAEHVFIAGIVVLISYFIGLLTKTLPL